MPDINPLDIYPFTIAQLEHFYKEVQAAGTFDALMKQKEALVLSGGIWVIAVQEPDDYKKKHLRGIYEPLREHYQTGNPFIFWAEMNRVMKKAMKLL